MIRIKDLKGFRYTDKTPSRMLTYMHLSFSNWKKDKDMLSFLSGQLSVIDKLIEELEDGAQKNVFNLKKGVHIVIRQDDKLSNKCNEPLVMLSSIKPMAIDRYIERKRNLSNKG